jgi:hypothetical protein
MEITGRIKSIGKTNNVSDSFRKREIIITTNEQYPQHLLLEFAQDKCEVLDGYKVGQDVEIGINLRGREWVNPEGVTKYFNTIQGWKIKELDGSGEETVVKQVNPVAQDDDLPF